MAERDYTNDEMRLEELRQQFLALSADSDCGGRITFRAPNGDYVGEVTLSVRDIEAVTESLISLNHYRAEAADPAAEPLPIDDEDDLDAVDIDELVGAFETLLKNEGGQA